MQTSNAGFIAIRFKDDTAKKEGYLIICLLFAGNEYTNGRI
jgi:hypothetical protein